VILGSGRCLACLHGVAAEERFTTELFAPNSYIIPTHMVALNLLSFSTGKAHGPV
jgi:hypothetical protein